MERSQFCSHQRGCPQSDRRYYCTSSLPSKAALCTGIYAHFITVGFFPSTIMLFCYILLALLNVVTLINIVRYLASPSLCWPTEALAPLLTAPMYRQVLSIILSLLASRYWWIEMKKNKSQKEMNGNIKTGQGHDYQEK